MDKREKAFIIAVERTSLLHADYLGAQGPQVTQETTQKIKALRRDLFPDSLLGKAINRLQLLHRNGLKVRMLKLALYETLLQTSEAEWRESFYRNLIGSLIANPSPAIRNLEIDSDINVG